MFWPPVHMSQKQKKKNLRPNQKKKKKLVVYNKENKWEKTYVRTDWFLR